MKYGIVHQFAGGTEAQYKALIAAVHPADGSLPAGQLLHMAGPSQDIMGPAHAGWTIIAVHESRESWETFRNEVVTPAMQAGIEGGFTELPEETEFEVQVEG
jgi:hypothetical protein